MSKPECIWDGHAQLAEGPMWSQREQALYWVDILGRRLYRHSHKDGTRHWQFDEEVSSVTERSEGPELLLTLRHGLAWFDTQQGKLTPILTIENARKENRLNDAKCDAAGRFWAGTMDFDAKAPEGALYRIDPDLRCMKVDEGYPVTNGPAWSADGRTMYFNDSINGRVYAFDFDPQSGTAGNKRLFLQLDKDEGEPDGMTTDSEGGLWLAQWGAWKLTRRDPQGRVLQFVELPCSQVSSCTFGGDSYRTLFVTTAAVGLKPEQLEREPLAGGVFAIPLDIAGMPANRFRG